MRVTQLLLGSFFVVLGCSSSSGSSSPSGTGTCPATIDGACVGVPSAAICNGSSCTDGVSCTTVIEVASSADLATAVTTATAGACIALANGHYAAVTLPGGVSLLGTGAANVTVEGVTVGAGNGATIRGMKITSGGLSATSALGLVLDRLDVAGGASFGVWLVDTEATMTASSVEDNLGYGIVAICKNACDPKPKLSFTGVLSQRNETSGMFLRGVDAKLTAVQLSQNKVKNFDFGRGLEIGNSSVQATSLVAQGNDGVGVLVTSGDVVFGPSFSVRDNLHGIQLQAVTSAKITGFEVRGSRAVGLGMYGAKGVVIQGGIVADTSSTKVGTDKGDSEIVGDGVNWLLGTEATIDSTVTVQSSTRRPVIADAASTGSLGVTLAGGDDAVGVVIQGGIHASDPVGITVADGTKTTRLAQSEAMPLAIPAAAAKAPGE